MRNVRELLEVEAAAPRLVCAFLPAVHLGCPAISQPAAISAISTTKTLSSYETKSPDRDSVRQQLYSALFVTKT
jgi:hypothetical protein